MTILTSREGIDLRFEREPTGKMVLIIKPHWADEIRATFTEIVWRELLCEGANVALLAAELTPLRPEITEALGLATPETVITPRRGSAELDGEQP